MKNLKFRSSTIGLIASHRNMKANKLIRVEFYENMKGDKITLKAVSGHNLSELKVVGNVIISIEEFVDRDIDPYDDLTEAKWAFDKMGLIFE